MYYLNILKWKILLCNRYGKVVIKKIYLIFLLFILDKMGKKHHIGGTTRILTFLVVVSIFFFSFLPDWWYSSVGLHYSCLWFHASLLLFFIFYNYFLKDSTKKHTKVKWAVVLLSLKILLYQAGIRTSMWSLQL